MMKLLVQSDDYGISKGVSAGIREAISSGLIRNTGVFINMENACSYKEELDPLNVCIGIDINFLCGNPVSDPALIPHLVRENGAFRHSGEIAGQNKYISSDALGLITTFDEDPFPYEEIYLETENQVKKFIEIFGYKPEYIHLHSLNTPNTLQAALDVADKYNIVHTYRVMQKYPILPGCFGGSKNQDLRSQMDFDVVENLLEHAIPAAIKNGVETGYWICHCGYVDYDLFSHTSLTLRRVRDLASMTDKRVKEYFDKHSIEVITYRDL